MALFGGGTQAVEDERDPLFYRGVTPVLGSDVEVRQTGELTGTFPEAGPPTSPGEPPTAPPRPDFPGAPEFPIWDFGLEPPTMPDRPIEQLGPGTLRPSWWQGAMQAANLANRGYQAYKRFKGQQQGTNAKPWAPDPSALTAEGDFWVPGAGGRISGEGFGVNPQTGQLESFGGAAAGAAVPGAGESAIEMTHTMPSPPTEGVGMPGLGDLAGPALQFLGGTYGALTGEPGSKGQVGSSANAVGGGAALLANAGLLPAGAAGLGPAAAAITIPLVMGSIYEGFFAPDKARFPEGYQFVPGSSEDGSAGAMGVDPSTGAMLVYKGDGKYEWAPQTLEGKRATPEQLLQWEMAPSGELLALPGYSDLGNQIYGRHVERWQSGQPNAATPEEISRYYQERRAPSINAIASANPGLSEGEIWAIYQNSPEYQQELAEQQQYAAAQAHTPDVG